MDSWSDTSADGRKKRSANFSVRFRHGVYPNPEGQATRADIKKYDYFFSGRQPWVSTPNHVDFVDETAQVTSDIENAEQREDSRARSLRSPKNKANEKFPKFAIRRNSARQPFRNSTISTSLFRPPASSNISGHIQVPFRRNTSPATSIASASSQGGRSSMEWGQESVTLPPRSDSQQNIVTSWPLSDPVEVYLFQFWVDNVAPKCDIVSPQQVFRNVVPQMALRNPMLLSAILMIAAQHIAFTDSSFPAKPYIYHERTLQQLVSYLAEKGKIEDECALASAIFLRCFEELYAGTNGQQNLSTFELFQGPNGWHFDMNNPVVQACLMIHVHFEIFQALLNRPSLRINYQISPISALESPSDDISWGNRIAWICARVLQWMSSGEYSTDNWHTLKEMVDEWERKRPSTFGVFPELDSDERLDIGAPPVSMYHACHVFANLLLIVCRMALAVKCKNSRYQSIYDQTDYAQYLREMISAARINSGSISAMLITAHAVHKFAPELQNHGDHFDVLQFLEELSSSGFPTAATQAWLKSKWGWTGGAS